MGTAPKGQDSNDRFVIAKGRRSTSAPSPSTPQCSSVVCRNPVKSAIGDADSRGVMRQSSGADRSAGFTLIEVITASLMILVLTGLAYPPLRSYWFRESLNGAASEMVTEMRGLQSRITAESHPLVYGIRLSTAENMMAEGRWGLVKYDPTGGTGGVPGCTQYATGSFDAGIFNATVSIVAPSFSASPEGVVCRASLGSASDQFVFFYARGTATGGTLTLNQPSLGSSEDITLQVFPLTGRIEQL